jgi:hypothetical protein
MVAPQSKKKYALYVAFRFSREYSKHDMKETSYSTEDLVDQSISKTFRFCGK